MGGTWSTPAMKLLHCCTRATLLEEAELRKSVCVLEREREGEAGEGERHAQANPYDTVGSCLKPNTPRLLVT